MKSTLPKLAIFLPSLRGGGVERTVVVLCRGLLEHGVAIDLVLARAQGPFLSQIPEGVRIIDLGRGHASTSLLGLASYLRRERPTYLFSAMNYVNITAILANELAGRPTHIIVREDNSPIASFARNRNPKARLVPALMRALYPRAGTVLAVSHGVADNLSKFIGFDRERIRVIWNPVVDEDLHRKAAMNLPDSWSHLEQQPFVLGVGSLIEQKNFSGLLKAFARVRAERPLRLVILGEGPLRAELEALIESLGIKDDVELPGFVDNPYAFMSRAAQFVLSSHFEGLPTVLIEAVACGCSVVSTDCPSGPHEILEAGRYGRLVPVDDVDALTKAMIETLDAPLDRERLKARGEDFSRLASVQGYLELLEDIARKRAV
jgi:glycosyltransferase involved in cell wall biosynthesis